MSESESESEIEGAFVEDAHHALSVNSRIMSVYLIAICMIVSLFVFLIYCSLKPSCSCDT